METYTQLSIFLENEPGTLKRVLDVFSERGINILANSVDNSIDCAVFRCVTTDPTQAVHLLGSAGTFVIATEVLGLRIDNSPGSLGAVAGKLAEGKVNIEYAYGSVADGGKALLILKPSDIKKARALLG